MAIVLLDSADGLKDPKKVAVRCDLALHLSDLIEQGRVFVQFMDVGVTLRFHTPEQADAAFKKLLEGMQ